MKWRREVGPVTVVVIVDRCVTVSVGPFMVTADRAGLTVDAFWDRGGSAGLIDCRFSLRPPPNMWLWAMVRNRRYGVSVSSTPAFAVAEYRWVDGEQVDGRTIVDVGL